jgi:hypothetical protein
VYSSQQSSCTLVFDGARDADDCLTFTIDGQNDRICGL